MSFTDQNKRILIEVVNHIHNAYVSDQAFQESENSITLPARLVRLSAEAIGQTYRQGILTSLDKSDLELLLHSLVKAIAAMKISLQGVIDVLPEQLPDELRNKLGAQLQEFESMRIQTQSSTSASSLIEASKESPPEKQAEDLLQRRDSLVTAQNTLSEVNLEELHEEVFRLEAEVEPKRRQIEELQRAVSEKTAELERLTNAIAEAEQVLNTNDTNAREQLDRIVNIAANMIGAVDPYLPTCEVQIREAVEKVAQKVSEGSRLKAELQGRITEVSELFAETKRISEALTLYLDADRRVARSMPTVISVTKEKLNRVEHQLREIDADL
jgi:hypothetical protein